MYYRKRTNFYVIDGIILEITNNCKTLVGMFQTMMEK